MPTLKTRYPLIKLTTPAIVEIGEVHKVVWRAKYHTNSAQSKDIIIPINAANCTDTEGALLDAGHIAALVKQHSDHLAVLLPNGNVHYMSNSATGKQDNDAKTKKKVFESRWIKEEVEDVVAGDGAAVGDAADGDAVDTPLIKKMFEVRDDANFNDLASEPKDLYHLQAASEAESVAVRDGVVDHESLLKKLVNLKNAKPETVIFEAAGEGIRRSYKIKYTDNSGAEKEIAIPHSLTRFIHGERRPSDILLSAIYSINLKIDELTRAADLVAKMELAKDLSGDRDRNIDPDPKIHNEDGTISVSYTPQSRVGKQSKGTKKASKEAKKIPTTYWGDRAKFAAALAETSFKDAGGQDKMRYFVNTPEVTGSKKAYFLHATTNSISSGTNRTTGSKMVRGAALNKPQSTTLSKMTVRDLKLYVNHVIAQGPLIKSDRTSLITNTSGAYEIDGAEVTNYAQCYDKILQHMLDKDYKAHVAAAFASNLTETLIFCNRVSSAEKALADKSLSAESAPAQVMRDCEAITSLLPKKRGGAETAITTEEIQELKVSALSKEMKVEPVRRERYGVTKHPVSLSKEAVAVVPTPAKADEKRKSVSFAKQPKHRSKPSTSKEALGKATPTKDRPLESFEFLLKNANKDPGRLKEQLEYYVLTKAQISRAHVLSRGEATKATKLELQRLEEAFGDEVSRIETRKKASLALVMINLITKEGNQDALPGVLAAIAESENYQEALRQTQVVWMAHEAMKLTPSRPVRPVHVATSTPAMAKGAGRAPNNPRRMSSASTSATRRTRSGEPPFAPTDPSMMSTPASRQTDAQEGASLRRGQSETLPPYLNRPSDRQRDVLSKTWPTAADQEKMSAEARAKVRSKVGGLSQASHNFAQFEEEAAKTAALVKSSYELRREAESAEKRRREDVSLAGSRLEAMPASTPATQHSSSDSLAAIKRMQKMAGSGPGHSILANLSPEPRRGSLKRRVAIVNRTTRGGYQDSLSLDGSRLEAMPVEAPAWKGREWDSSATSSPLPPAMEAQQPAQPFLVRGLSSRRSARRLDGANTDVSRADALSSKSAASTWDGALLRPQSLSATSRRRDSAQGSGGFFGSYNPNGHPLYALVGQADRLPVAVMGEAPDSGQRFRLDLDARARNGTKIEDLDQQYQKMRAQEAAAQRTTTGRSDALDDLLAALPSPHQSTKTGAMTLAAKSKARPAQSFAAGSLYDSSDDGSLSEDAARLRDVSFNLGQTTSSPVGTDATARSPFVAGRRVTDDAQIVEANTGLRGTMVMQQHSPAVGGADEREAAATMTTERSPSAGSDADARGRAAVKTERPNTVPSLPIRNLGQAVFHSSDDNVVHKVRRQAAAEIAKRQSNDGQGEGGGRG